MTDNITVDRRKYSPLPYPPRCAIPLSSGTYPGRTQLQDSEHRSALLNIGSAPSIFRHRFLPWLRDSAWPRLILVGFHAAELCERTIPLASLAATLGDLAFCAPLMMAPGMIARYLARRLWAPRSSRDEDIVSAVRTTLKLSLVRDDGRRHTFS